jgi:hypothetical protein
MIANNVSGGAVFAVRGLLLAATGLLALFNGSLWSPLFDPVAQILHLATRSFPLMTPQRLFYITPVAIGLMTLVLAGIPAALYERIRGLQTSSPVSIGIWLAVTLLLTLPTIMNALGEE